MGLLRVACPECAGAGRFSIGGANNPFTRIYVCEECAGTGRAMCSVESCACEATDAVVLGRDVRPMCDRHMAAWQEEEAYDDA